MTNATQSDRIGDVHIDWVPDGRPDWHEGWINGYARGLQLIANYLRGPAQEPLSYDDVLGDLGVAFAMPSDGQSISHYDGWNDVGWWPLEPLGLARLGFLEHTLGFGVKLVTAPEGAPADAVALYRECFQPAVIESLSAGKPCLLGFPTWWCIITGHDADGPFYGMCPNVLAGQEQVTPVEIEETPMWLLVLGDPVPAMDRRAADREALRYAVALHHERVMVGNAPDIGDYPLGHAEMYLDRWHTGRDAFADWITWLADDKRLDEPARTHANSKGFLIRNRRTAVRNLQAMRARHGTALEQPLGAAIARYKEIVVAAQRIDTAQETVSSAAGRQQMIAQIRRVAALESQAADALASALATIQ